MKFRNEYWFLSNMYPCYIEYKGYKFTCSEALFQALKCSNKEDIKKFEGVDGYTARNIGRKIKLRKDWNEIRDNAMWTCLVQKFIQNPELRTHLRKTGSVHIAEDNTWNDTYWGVCNGIGKNVLGNMLMKLRDKLY